MKPFPDLDHLPAFSEGSQDVNVIVETPQGSANKYSYDPATGLFKLGGAMPAGAIFPFEFGFIPSTLGEDGDPLDLLILLDSPTFVGCLVKTRLIGVIEAEQTEGKKTFRNDRLIGVAVKSRRHEEVFEARALPRQLLKEIEHFFFSYNAVKEKGFRVLARRGAAHARSLVRRGEKAWAAHSKQHPT